MTEALAIPAGVDFMDDEDQPEVEWPPQDLQYDDGEPMESPWHREAATLLKAGYIAACGGESDDYFVGCNMFLYYKAEQYNGEKFRGPDFFVVKGVDGSKHRDLWATWREGGRYPNVIIELLSDTTEKNDLTEKKTIYEQTFHTPEYFCIAPQMARLIGWRHNGKRYLPIDYNQRRWLFSEELNLWLGSWYGTYMKIEATWPRWYTADEQLVLLPEEAAHERAEAAHERAEAERQRAEAERQRAETAEQRIEAAEERAARLAARLRELGLDPDV